MKKYDWKTLALCLLLAAMLAFVSTGGAIAESSDSSGHDDYESESDSSGGDSVCWTKWKW